VSLPLPQLDDRDFQSLVDEARTRIARTCPAWNEHNVSDPGITLIELFAWMTDLLLYRVNRIPEKAQIALLDLMGVQLSPAETASAELRFRLSAPAAGRVELPAGRAEVGTPHGPARRPVVFRTVEPIVVPPLRLEALRLRREGRASDVPVHDGTARLTGAERLGLCSAEHPGDALALGFGEPLCGLVVAVTVAAEPARGTGVAPDAPPWAWEVEEADGTRSPATVVSDTTGGFNYGSGAIELQLPRIETPPAGGRRLRWLRCRLTAHDPGSEQPGYTHAPRLREIRAAAVGACVRAEHVEVAEDELLGYSDGTPGQSFRLRNAPALALDGDDGLELADPDTGAWAPWTLVESFADSGPQDPHYRFDPVLGEVSLGPAIRERRGWLQRGAIPPEGAALRVRRYRWGGGERARVDAGTLTVLRRALPGIASVTNPAPAHGAAPAETLAEARRRAPLELRTRSRAVTAEDCAVLARQASRAVARAHCVAPAPGEPVVVRILPAVAEPADPGPLADLRPSAELLAAVRSHLDERRLLGARIEVLPVRLRGALVVAEVEPDPRAERAALERLVVAALRRYVNPYVGGDVAGEGDGWAFGRALGAGELEVVVRRVRGVRDLALLRLYAVDPETGRPGGRPLDALEIEADELVASGGHLIRVLEPAAR
jgi:predicted phage baseplate assembly protein